MACARPRRAGELVRKISAGDALSPRDASACRELARNYSLQLLNNEHLAAVWGRADEVCSGFHCQLLTGWAIRT